MMTDDDRWWWWQWIEGEERAQTGHSLFHCSPCIWLWLWWWGNMMTDDDDDDDTYDDIWWHMTMMTVNMYIWWNNIINHDMMILMWWYFDNIDTISQIRFWFDDMMTMKIEQGRKRHRQGTFSPAAPPHIWWSSSFLLQSLIIPHDHHYAQVYFQWVSL